MGMAGSDNLTVAQAQYEALFQEFFGGGVPGAAQLFAQEVDVPGRRLSVPVATSFPRIRRWLGDKIFKSLRAFRQDIDVDPWEASIELDRLDVMADPTGVVDTVIRAFLGSEVSSFDDMVFTELLANPVGYDGVSLLNDAHPFSNGTGDNLTTAAISHVDVRLMHEQMRGFQDEDGRPLQVVPNTLLVGTDLEHEALEIAGADKPIFFNNTGAEAAAAVIGGVVIENVTKGRYNVVVSEWITGNQWFLMDLRRPGLRPIIVPKFRSFEPQMQDRMDAEGRFVADKVRASLEGDYGVGAGLWWLVGGRIAA